MALIRLNFDTSSSYELPFHLRLSFKGVFEHWENMAASEDPGKASYAREVLAQLEHAPALRGPIDDIAILEDYESEVALLLSALFPEALKTNEIKAAGLPFTPIFFNPSERFANIVRSAPEDYVISQHSFMPDDAYMMASVFILNSYYNLNLDLRRPLFFSIPDANGQVHHYRIFINVDFATFQLNDPDFQLSREDIDLLLDNFEDIGLWKSKIPPNIFSFEGFALLSMFDVTKDQILSDLKDVLLRPDALQNDRLLNQVQQHLQSIFGIKDLRLGYAFLNKDGEKLTTYGTTTRSLLLPSAEEVDLLHLFFDDTQKDCLKRNRPVAISNIDRLCSQKSHRLLEQLREQDIGSYMISPIKDNGKFIGVFELGAKDAGVLNSVLADKLIDILPMFSIALQRQADDYQTRLEAIIQDKCTAIHPSVSWRFFDEAARYHEASQSGEEAEMQDIVFENVYPLYGQSDIKGSSTERNQAIQEDLLAQLKLASKVLDRAAEHLHLPILKQLRFRIKTFYTHLRKGLRAGDEVDILAFLQHDVYPVFNHLRTLDEHLKELVDDYMSHLDPELGVLYKKRKQYEDSVSMLNDKIAAYLDQQQAEAQAMYPHYFEKYKTDGVEHNIYIGDSLTKNQPFANLYLQNLRLWQLLTICGVEQLVQRLKRDMPMPLDVASLVLVHSSPMSIKFKMAEKHFDVDGAYNIRYEIIKKRIDKALIKGTQERLTQTGKIAIVYTQEEDAAEYKRYLQYLHSIGQIEAKIEDLELEDLQGVHGLRALRATMVYETLEAPVPRIKKPKQAKVTGS